MATPAVGGTGGGAGRDGGTGVEAGGTGDCDSSWVGGVLGSGGGGGTGGGAGGGTTKIGGGGGALGLGAGGGGLFGSGGGFSPVRGGGVRMRVAGSKEFLIALSSQLLGASGVVRVLAAPEDVRLRPWAEATGSRVSRLAAWPCAITFGGSVPEADGGTGGVPDKRGGTCSSMPEAGGGTCGGTGGTGGTGPKDGGTRGGMPAAGGGSGGTGGMPGIVTRLPGGLPAKSDGTGGMPAESGGTGGMPFKSGGTCDGVTGMPGSIVSTSEIDCGIGGIVAGLPAGTGCPLAESGGTGGMPEKTGGMPVQSGGIFDSENWSMFP